MKDSIVSVHNPHVKDVCALHRRRGRLKQGRFLLEGWHLLNEALRWRISLETVYCGPDIYEQVRDLNAQCTIPENQVAQEKRADFMCKADHLWRSALLRRAADRGADLIEVSENVLKKICLTEEPQGVAAVARWLERPRLLVPEKKTDVFLILDRIQDPGNLGGILRVALAADVRGVLLMKGCADPYGSKALRGSMGSLFGLTILPEVEVAECREICSRMEGHIVALAASGQNLYNAKSFYKGQNPLVLILGNEGQGVAPELLELAEDSWSLPMCHGVESLNVAVAAGIVLYEARRLLKKGEENG